MGRVAPRTIVAVALFCGGARAVEGVASSADRPGAPPASGAGTTADPEPCVAGSTWVELDVAATDPLNALSGAILAQLRAGLRGEAIGACRSGASKTAVPVAVVEMTSERGTTVLIDVRDRVTQKQVLRTVELERLPEDSRALALAVAADELLRASWTEIAIERPGTEPAPRAVEQRVRASLSPAFATQDDEIGPRFSAEHYGGGQTLFGVDLAARHWFGERFGATVALGFRGAESVATVHGQITGSAFAAGAGGTVALFRSRRITAAVDVGVWALRASFHGEPVATATGAYEAGVALFGRAGASLGVHLFRVAALELRAGAGAPFRALDVLDSRGTATGISGLELYGSAGVEVTF